MCDHETTGDDLLRAYLATADAICPSCGYDLRGSATAHCPECGHGLKLGLRVPGRLWRRRGLLLMVLAWLLLAGVMNGVRTGREIHRTATVSAPWIQLTTFNRQLGVKLPSKSVDMPLTITTPTPVDGGSAVRYAVLTGNTRGPVGRATWASVAWSQWARLAGWTTLGALALAGLVLLARCGRRPTADRAARVALAIAWIGFGGYALYHVAIFATELPALVISG